MQLLYYIFYVNCYFESTKTNIVGGGSVEEYKKVNAQESQDLADAFLSYKFLDVSILGSTY